MKIILKNTYMKIVSKQNKMRKNMKIILQIIGWKKNVWKLCCTQYDGKRACTEISLHVTE